MVDRFQHIILLEKIYPFIKKDEKVPPHLQYFERTQVAEDDEAALPYGQLWPKR